MNIFIDTAQPYASQKIALAIIKSASKTTKIYRELLFLCIGSDRMIGDCLGPLTGELLKSKLDGVCPIYGTMTETIHACNLSYAVDEINTSHPHALVMAIDASLGSKKHLGYATVANGALFPGAGVHKKLPPVGDLHITGIVNTTDFQDYLALQTTRLSTVLMLSDIICQGILLALPSLSSGCTVL